jgi:hypothetical protein
MYLQEFGLKQSMLRNQPTRKVTGSAGSGRASVTAAGASVACAGSTAFVGCVASVTVVSWVGLLQLARSMLTTKKMEMILKIRRAFIGSSSINLPW